MNKQQKKKPHASHLHTPNDFTINYYGIVSGAIDTVKCPSGVTAIETVSRTIGQSNSKVHTTVGAPATCWVQAKAMNKTENSLMSENTFILSTIEYCLGWIWYDLSQVWCRTGTAAYIALPEFQCIVYRRIIQHLLICHDPYWWIYRVYCRWECNCSFSEHFVRGAEAMKASNGFIVRGSWTRARLTWNGNVRIRNQTVAHSTSLLSSHQLNHEMLKTKYENIIRAHHHNM